MCGIVGIVGRPPNDRSLIERMTAQLEHRGPDDSGTWSSERADVGHTRLSILDLTDAGHQPMTLGPLVLSYNGEIYNYRELRKGLSGPFFSDTDSEVVLHAYREHGADCVQGFSGMFSFAIWDDAEKRLFAARDRFGIKPLYYRPFEGGIAFASEARPLLELGRPEIDLNAIADYLTYGYVPAPKTGWVGIRKLPPGHTLTWQEDETSSSRYWGLQVEPREMTLQEAAEELDELLRRAVSEHMLADVPVGVLLSSGLDSASLAAYLERPLTFTLGQHETHRDEIPGARALAEHFGTEHYDERAAVPDIGKAVETIVEVFGEPFGDSSALSVWLLSRFTSRKVKVALSGEGGDEIFCGYRWYGNAIRRPSTLALRLGELAAPPMTRLGRWFQRRSTEGVERYASFLSPFTPRQRQTLIGPCLEAASEEDPLWLFRRHWRSDLALHRRLQWADIHTYLADGLLTKVDRASMAFSLEVRPPLLDHRLVEWAVGLDVSLQRDLASERGKLVLRRLMKDRLPAGHLDLPKRGFNLPIRRWIRQRPLVLREALDRLEANEVVQLRKPWRLTNDQVWLLLVLDRWLQRHASFYS